MGLEEQSVVDIGTNRVLCVRVALLRSRAVIGIVSGVVLAWLGNGPPKSGRPKAKGLGQLGGSHKMGKHSPAAPPAA